MTSIPFWKLQAIGNDFPLFHAEDLHGVDLSELAIKAADRKFGIGGDGILVVGRLGTERVLLRMFNPDGTEDFCGNGLRIAARHAFDQGWVAGDFTIQHLDRAVAATVQPDELISTTIGSANYDPSVVPIDRPSELFDDAVATVDGKEWVGSALSTGSTHTVLRVEELPSTEETAMVGSALEHNPLFPERTSVIFSKALDPMTLQIRIWERGVGETLGCGTGSSAAAADHLRRTGGGGVVTVQNPGGTIQVEMADWRSSITISGFAEETYRGHFQL